MLEQKLSIIITQLNQLFRQIIIMNLQNRKQIRVKHYIFNKDNILTKGPNSTTYLASDLDTNHQFAIKVINMKTCDNQINLYLLNNQKKAMMILKHPNILNAIDIIQQLDYCYIITEYCNGGSLVDKMKQKKIQQKQALQIFRGMIQGYKIISEQGIIHRNLKPSNILFHNNIPKISDFAYCDFKNQVKPRSYYDVGSSSYLSPEAYLKNLYSQKSDIWALGLILYEMLIGIKVQFGQNIVESFNHIKKTGLNMPTNISNLSKDIITSCLNINHNKRINIQDLRKKMTLNLNYNYDTKKFPKLTFLKDFNHSLNQKNNLLSVDEPSSFQLQFNDYCHQSKQSENIFKSKLAQTVRYKQQVGQKKILDFSPKSAKQNNSTRINSKHSLQKSLKKKIFFEDQKQIGIIIQNPEIHRNDHQTKITNSYLGKTAEISRINFQEPKFLREYLPLFRPIPVVHVKFN